MDDRSENGALLVIDMQKYFFKENQQVDVPQLVASCQEAMRIARAAGMPVVHVITQYRSDQRDWPAAWRGDPEAWCARLATDHELAQQVEGLAPTPEDFVVIKKRFSGFYNTELDDVLRSLGCSHLYAAGYATDVCVRMTLIDAYNRGYKTTIIEEAVEAFRETNPTSIAHLEWLIDTRRLTLKQYQARFTASPA